MTNVTNISVYISLSWEDCRTSKFYEVFILTETSEIKLQDDTEANLPPLPYLTTDC